MYHNGTEQVSTFASFRENQDEERKGGYRILVGRMLT